MKNLFACLVHERPDVAWDLVCNLRCLDPASSVLLYNSGSASLLEDCRFHRAPGVFIHPHPKPQRYGALHGYMTDCLRWACQTQDFDTITNVDSDQLLLHPGYTEQLAKITTQHPNLGMVRSSPATIGWPTTGSQSLIPLGFVEGLSGSAVISYPQYTALNEFKAWSPFLMKFGNSSEHHFNGLIHFPKWTFWPGTVFSRQAAQAILSLLDTNIYLHALIGRSQIFATEEIIFPTLISLLGFDLVQTPFDEACLRFQTRYSNNTLEESLRLPNQFWMHPVPRDMDDPLRTHLRAHYRQYQA